MTEPPFPHSAPAVDSDRSLAPGHDGRSKHGGHSRRAMLAWMVAGAAVGGCDWFGGDREVEPQAAQTPTASNVPLRILSAASPELNERIEAAWSAISEQPIEIIPVSEGAQGFDADALGQSDVLLFPSARMGDLQAANALTALPEAFLRSDVVDGEALLEGLMTDAGRWGSGTYGLPLGTVVPALWLAPDVESPGVPTWRSFAELVETLPEGSVAEPLAEGWAGLSFLSRAASLTGGAWLFDRQSFQPALTEPPYVRALEQMVQVRGRYPENLLTPAEIWSQLESGQLKCGIGWPTGDAGSDETAVLPRLVGFPAGEEIFIDSWQPLGTVPRQVVASSRGLVVGISRACRQTSAARALVGWLASRDALGALRGAGAEVLPNRVPPEATEETSTAVAQALPADPTRRAYDDYLVAMLGPGKIRPSLRIPGAEEYLRALDQAVVAAVQGEAAADQVLATVAEDWQSITDRYGREEQVRAWRQSQGLRAR